MSAVSAEQAYEPSESDRVRANVELHFLEIGFDPIEARALADARADWHDAKRMLDEGCSHKVCLDILL